MDNSKCAVLVPVAREIEPETEDGLRILASRGYMVRLLHRSSQVDLARSTLVTEALNDGFSETMWIDSDQTFNPDDVDRLRSHNLPFVVGLYVQKGPKRFAGMFPADTGRVTFGKGGGLVPMSDVGFGFTYVRAEVYRAIQQRLPQEHRMVMGGYQGKMITPYFLPLVAAKNSGHYYLSEDYSFTHRAKEAGFIPMADTTIRVGHIGRKEYTWDDLTWSPERLESLEIAIGESSWKFPADVRGWLTDEEGIGLSQMARDRDVLEVGSYCGRSAICMAQTAKSLVCVDPFDCRDTPGEGDTFGEFCENLTRYGVTARTIKELFADATVTDKFDLVFIDGAHDEASVSADAARAVGLLKPDGLLAFHDARPRPGFHDGGWHPGVTNTVNRLIAEGAEIVRMVGTIAVIRPVLSLEKGSPMSAKLYEKLGRQQETIEDLNEAYTALLNLLANVVGGQVARSRLLVNLTNRSWELAPEGQRPGMPATINGQPVCVVAPDEPAPAPEEPANGHADRFASIGEASQE